MGDSDNKIEIIGVKDGDQFNKLPYTVSEAFEVIGKFCTN